MRYVMAFNAETFEPFHTGYGFTSYAEDVSLYHDIEECQRDIEEWYGEEENGFTALVKFFEVNEKDSCTKFLGTKRITIKCEWANE